MTTRRQIGLSLFTLPMLFGLAWAQGAMNVDTSPSLNVIGLYSLSADREAYSRFIKEQIDDSDPANLSEDVREKLRRLGHEPKPYTAEDRQEKEEDLRYHMDEAAVLEVLVKNPDASFDVGKFVQPDPARSENFWQVAWNEKFLTSDGETIIGVYPCEPPDLQQYRVVFVIHFWLPNQPLRSSYGELALPAMQPLPERLWRLAPYEVPS